VLTRDKNWVATLALWGKVTAGAMLTKCGMRVDVVDVITCAIFGDCRLRGFGVARGVNLPSPVDLRCFPYNSGHTILCDRVIVVLNHLEINSVYYAPTGHLWIQLRLFCLTSFNY